MTDRGADARCGRLRSVLRLSRLLRAVYLAAAVLGTAVTPPLILVVFVPAAGLTGFAGTVLNCWYLTGRWPDRRPSGSVALLAATAAPFFHAVELLGRVGDLLAVALSGLLALLWLSWLRLTAATPCPEAADAGAQGRPGGEQSLRELLHVLPLEILCSEWRGHQQDALRTGAAPDPVLARAQQAVLQELARRDPAGFRRWVAQGAADSPESYLRSAS